MFQPYKVFKKVAENNDISSYYLKPINGSKIETYKPGQFLPIKINVKDREEAILRTYTLSDRPGKDYYRLTVKRENGGLASNYMHESVSEGDVIQAESPRGDFYLSKNDNVYPMILLSGGVGITPMLSILNECIDNQTEQDIWFIHGSRNKDTQIKLERLRQLDEKRPNVHVHIHHSEPLEDEEEGYHYDQKGRITPEFLKTYLPDNRGLFFLCGPPFFMKSLHDALRSWEVPPNRIRYEYFKEGQKLESIAAVSNRETENTFTVHFENSGISTRWDDSYDSILELAESKGLSIPYDCRMGTCSTCESNLISGEVIYEPEPFVEIEEGRILVCCSQPGSDITIDR